MAIPLAKLEGKYEILEKLQEGGMGAIYKVRHRLLGEARVVKVMRTMDAKGAPEEPACWDLIEQGIYIDANSTLEAAMPVFDKSAVGFIPVVTLWGDGRAPELLGVLSHVDALKAYNRALAATAAEEHS